MQARPFLSLAGLGWFGDLRGGVAQRSNRLGRRFEYIEQCSEMQCARCYAVLSKKRREKAAGLACIDILDLLGRSTALRRIRAATARTAAESL